MVRWSGIEPSRLTLAPPSGQRSGIQPSRARAVFLFCSRRTCRRAWRFGIPAIPPTPFSLPRSSSSTVLRSASEKAVSSTHVASELPPSDGLIVGVSFGPRWETYFVTCLVARTGRQSTPHSTATPSAHTWLPWCFRIAAAIALGASGGIMTSAHPQRRTVHTWHSVTP